MFSELVGEGLEFVIPLLSEASDEGLAQELIDRQVEFFALLDGIAAYIPAVVVQPDGAVAEALGTDWIEGAGDGFAETRLAASESLLQGTQTAVAIVTSEGTVFAVHDARHKVALLVGICHALLIDDGLCRSREHRPHRVEGIFNVADFFERHRRTGITLDATDAATLLVVAAEAFGQDVRRNQHVAHL